MATWFFGQETSGMTAKTFKRASTTSFGSICFGSLLVAVIRAIEVFVKMARDDARKQDNELLQCVLCCMQLSD